MPTEMEPEMERLTALMNASLARVVARWNGSARQARWDCEDGWVTAYTTERVRGGPHDGRFVTMLYKPTGKGSRSGKASEWTRTYLRAFSTRKAARRRAETLFYQHSPRRAARHGRS